MRPAGADLPVLRSHGTVDLTELASIDELVRESGSARINLRLADDVEFDGVVARTVPTSAGVALSGSGSTGESFTIVLNGDMVAGDIRGPQGVYRLLGRSATVQVQQIDPASVARCEGGLTAEEPAAQRPERPEASPLHLEAVAASQNDGSTIDVFVFYTSTIRRTAGGHELMRAIVDLDVAWTNEAYRASGVRQRVNLVGVAELEDFPADEGFPLHRLTYRVPDVRTIRDSYAADLVALKFRGSGGLAWLSVLHPRAEHLGFSLVGLYGPDTFAHELGHNMGLRHPRNGVNPDVENTPYPYSHGYVLPGLPKRDPNSNIRNSTIMDDQPGAGLQRFSDPRAEYRGVPLGVPGDEPSPHTDGPADAVRSLDNTYRAVANFRSSGTRCDYRLSPASSAAPSAGGTFTIGVQTGAHCAWTVATHDPGVILQAGAGGSGNGRVRFRVEPNAGWERTVALRIGGEMHVVRQASDRTPAPVCGRSPAVVDAIIEALGKPCAEVRPRDLNAIPRLDVEAETVPVAGDFDGMTNLGGLSLRWSEDAPLPAAALDGLVNVVELSLAGAGVEPGALDSLISLGTLVMRGGRSLGENSFRRLSGLRALRLVDFDVPGLRRGTFRGLDNLSTLSIRNSRVGRVEQGAFEGLAAIRTLSMVQGEIDSLAPGAFRSLGTLDTLQLYGNDLTSLPAGAFDGLASLRWLNLQSNALADLDPGSFRGLSTLRYLYLDGNRLQSLPEGIFDDLTGLRWRLNLSDNQLEALRPGTFERLGDLYALMLGGNDLARLAPDTFRGLESLIVLDLAGNGLEELDAGTFRTVPDVGELRLHDNALTRLPERIFEGLTELSSVTLRDNPGAPFPFEVDLVRAARAGTGIEAVALSIEQGAPFAMTAGLSVDGGRVTDAEVHIQAGQLRGAGIPLAPAGDGTVRVTVRAVPENPTALGCESVNAGNYGNLKPCYPGIALVPGEPLVLYGIPDQALSDNRPVTVDLNDVFGVFFDTAALSFTATSGDPGVVGTSLARGVLTLTPGAGGTATVIVVASDGRTQVTREFVVTVPETLRTRWRGWRLRTLIREADDA